MFTPKILLVGDRETRPCWLLERLNNWGGQCQFAFSRTDVAGLVRTESFDLVLSRMRLRDGNAFQLIPLFEGRSTSLFSYLSARDGRWWLPLLASGSECEHGPALQEPEFMNLLQRTVQTGSAALSRLAVYGAPSW